MHGLPEYKSENLITQNMSKADGAVYRLTDNMYGIYTVDVFSPIVDDPEDFGEVAFANCISDVCAMGGKPILALNVCMFPARAPVDKLNLILKGASKSAKENSVLIAGGHTTKNDELHYGMSVFGIVSPENLRLASNAKIGDHIILTKGIGTGILFAAKDREEGVDWDSAVSSMKQTSIKASDILSEFDCDCCTDVTGFGLVPHLLEVLDESNVSANIYPSKIPLLPGVDKLASSYACPVLSDNMELAGSRFDVGNFEPMWTNICFDAQTSGGFIAFVAPEMVETCVQRLREAGYPASDIGVVTKGTPKVTLV
ncbi:MAG: selenide, water dikinase SelD [Caldisericia bacterium]|nr:selenide, water dikinase SelD [Caldisericia bacterium]